jgi:hypothetical protein
MILMRINSFALRLIKYHLSLNGTPEFIQALTIVLKQLLVFKLSKANFQVYFNIVIMFTSQHSCLSVSLLLFD